MPAKTVFVVLSALCLTGCGTGSAWRPCGPGILNNALVPQGFAGADFRPACQRHDNCYTCGPSRKACDDQFLRDMVAACDCSCAPGLCRLRAMQWYLQARLFGGHAYEGQNGNGCCGGCGNGCCACQP